MRCGAARRTAARPLSGARCAVLEFAAHWGVAAPLDVPRPRRAS
ncbi:hypothetical protein OH687_11755 [Burkholderia anthina]|nr:hypothetical protein OH687_11755 [Burkholderia anthina]